MTGKSENIKYLLENGADIDAEDIKGRTPLMLAVLHGQWKVVTELLKNPKVDPFLKIKQVNRFLMLKNGSTLGSLTIL